jgi:hypothetical protein
MRRIVVAVAAIAAVAVVVASPASAGTVPSYSLSGIETGIPASAGGDESTSPFAGAGFSWTAGFATWTADVTHHSLDACATLGDGCITGGDFSLSGSTSITGSFADGSIHLVSGRSAPPCTSKAVYSVAGDLDLDGGGTATFTARLTHYQVQLFGVCVPYFATVSGTFGP